MKKVPYGRDDENIANITSAKYYLLRAFTEKLKQFSSILTKIWMLAFVLMLNAPVKKIQSCWDI